jgi:antitoxin MazE
VKVAKWGNSLAVRIPKDVAEALNLEEGSEIRFVPLEDGVGVARRPDREEEILGLRKFRGRMPRGFSFDREEANGR